MNGKEKCELLKDIRRRIAEQYGLEYHPAECHNEGDCAGTCPQCDEELKDLQRQLDQKGIQDIALDEVMREKVENLGQIAEAIREEILSGLTQGILEPDPDERLVLQGEPSAYPDKKKKIPYKECTVAGWSYRNPDEIWNDLYEGAELALIRDKKNKYDRYAIAVALYDEFESCDCNPDKIDPDSIIGYVPRTENKTIAQIMDMGWDGVFTARLTTVKVLGSYTDRLRMTIYIQSKDDVPDADMGKKLFVQYIGDDDYAMLSASLGRRGYACFHWDRSWPDGRTLPAEGDKVLFIHRKYDRCVLYWMYLEALDDHAARFLDDSDKVAGAAGHSPHIFMNVKGPVTCTVADVAFLDDETVSDSCPENTLSEYAENRLLEILG